MQPSLLRLNLNEIPENSPPFPEDFPKNVNLDTIQCLAACTLRELIQQVQEAQIPAYCLAVVGSRNENESRSFYQIYDSAYFSTYIHNCNAESKEPTTLIDPMTRRTIQSIHFFVLNCFKVNFHTGTLIEPIDLSTDTIEFKPVVIEDPISVMEGFKGDILKIYLNSLNSNIITSETSTIEDKKIVKKGLGIIANLISRGVTFYVRMSDPEEKEAQTLIWKTCYSKQYKKIQMSSLKTETEKEIGAEKSLSKFNPIYEPDNKFSRQFRI